MWSSPNDEDFCTSVFGTLSPSPSSHTATIKIDEYLYQQAWIKFQIFNQSSYQIFFLTLSMLSVLSFMIDACASLSNIALKIFLLWIGWCFRNISMINFLLNMVRAISFRTGKRNRNIICHIIGYLTGVIRPMAWPTIIKCTYL